MKSSLEDESITHTHTNSEDMINGPSLFERFNSICFFFQQKLISSSTYIHILQSMAFNTRHFFECQIKHAFFECKLKILPFTCNITLFYGNLSPFHVLPSNQLQIIPMIWKKHTSKLLPNAEYSIVKRKISKLSTWIS